MRCQGRTPSGQRSVAAARVLAALALAGSIAIAGSARGQAPSPDTELTPVAKDPGEEWAYVGGGEFGSQARPAGSATPLSVDFFGVGFINETDGFFAGSQCLDPDASFDELGGCERAPAIYGHSVAPGQPAEVRQVLGPEASGESEPGYVAAVAWISPGRAIAVGGTGSYPRRELARLPGETDAEYAARDLAGEAPNAAGRARAWLLDRSLFGDADWHEITDIPADADGAPAGGLTAVDCSPRLGTDGALCIAGGLRQLWTIRDGKFSDSFTPSSAEDSGEPTVEDGDEWRFRVRSIAFQPGAFVRANQPTAVAVTSGCCAEGPLENAPRMLLYDGERWHVRLLSYNDSGLENEFADDVLEPTLGIRPTDGADSAQRSLRPQTLPDSFFHAAFSDHGDDLTVVATPGAPPPDADDPLAEPVSRLVRVNPKLGSQSVLDGVIGVLGLSQPCRPDPGAGGHQSDLSGNLCGELGNPNPTDLRLAAADGDFARAEASSLLTSSTGAARPDGLIDWAVGSLAASGPGHADRGAAYTTVRRGNLTPNPLECTLLQFNVDCRPKDAEDVVGETESHSLYALPTYALNAFAFTPGGGVGWAAGDKGAILRLGGEGTVASQTSEPAPPKLGAARTERVPESRAFDDARPRPAGSVGEVPALGDQPVEHLDGPELIPAGSPSPRRPQGSLTDSVRTVVMSRDGSEGWALGGTATKSSQGTILHYTGGRWRRCESRGIPGQTAADRACADLAFLQGSAPVQLLAAARVPLERDGDPTNDDDFELVALGTEHRLDDGVARRLVLRYRRGSWSIDEAAMKQIDPADPGRSPDFSAIALTAPDDGWILAANESGASGMELYRLGEDGWIDCSAGAQARESCGDAAGVLPLGQESTPTRPFILTAAEARVYLAGTRTAQQVTAELDETSSYPVILSLDSADEGAAWTAEHDPGCPDPASGQCVPSGDRGDQGRISAFSAARRPDGRYVGWAAGLFGPGELADSDPARAADLGADAALLRLVDEAGTRSWEKHSAGDAADDYLFAAATENTSSPPTLLTTIAADGAELSVLAPAGLGDQAAHPMLAFDSAGGDSPQRWQVFPTPFALRPLGDSTPWNALAASVQRMAPDGRGGFWLAARRAPTTGAKNVFFYRYGDERPKPVFTDAPHPIREAITGAAGTADGRLWVSTDAGVVYRHDRLTGWDRMTIPGWDPGRVVTRTSRANAIAVGPDGEGVVVGEGGRIAAVGPRGVKLDAAAGARLCEPQAPVAPCGTGRELHSAAVAPDGSALVGGEGRALLWRPPGGEFRAIARPLTAVNATFTGIAMPSTDRAWISTDTGQIFAGRRSGAGWSWRLENVNAEGELVTLDAGRRGIALNALAVDAGGRGYAVGEHGLILERTADAPQPWRRVDAGVREHLHSVALPQGDGSGALIGGELGLVLTHREGTLEVARTGEFTDPVHAGRSIDFTARVVGLALLPGYEGDEVEAWALSQSAQAGGHRRPAAGAVLHYASDPDAPLLSTGGRIDALPDAPAAGHSELSFAAFGRSDCHLESASCIEPHGTNFVNEVVSRRIADELGAAPGAAEPADFALFTGDVDRAAGRDGGTGTPLDVDVMHRRWLELVAGDLAAAGLPLFGAIGVQDLSQAKACPPLTGGRCFTSQQAGAGTTGPWRESFAAMPQPWGGGEEASTDSLSFEPAPGQGGIVEPDDAIGADAGARTHYAVDVERDGEPLARIVFLDNSMRSLTASDPQQSPIEAQTDFLRRMLCSGGGECTRRDGQEAVVVFNTPTYSYEPSASSGGVETATDAAALETVLLRERANLVVSGRLGWNGLYYALAPGLHCPSPGAGHPDPAERPTESSGGAGCDAGAEDVLDELQRAAPVDGSKLREALDGETPTGELPFVVASGAGGTFGPVSEPVDGSASQGFWHGYSLVHLDTETGRARVEQRPVFDWIGISAAEHELLPRSRMTVKGFGREAAGADTPLRYDRIDSHAITHRYDLLLADPERPWLACPASDPRCASLHAKLAAAPGDDSTETGPAKSATADRCAPYLCLPERIGGIDRTTGEVSSGDGRHPDAFALAALSVGERTATWPLVFRASPSFVVTPFEGPPPIVGGATPKAPAPPPIPEPHIPGLTLPQLPTLPVIPPIAAQTPPEPQPPAPPAPPPPAEQPSPVSLSVAPTGLTVATPTAVLQPPTPPVNPAPPGGARREARQRQAAAQKSGADSEQAENSSEGGVDPSDAQNRVNPVDSPVQPATRHASGGRTESAATRRDRVRPVASISAVPPPEQPSAWATGALYGGGVTLMALALALGWTRGRPTPRRREPERPAPAWITRR